MSTHDVSENPGRAALEGAVARKLTHRVLAVSVLSCGVAWPQTSPPARSNGGDLTTVSIENLMTMDVTSVSKKEQKLSRTASAIFVITQEDILRSGATNIPDLLRIVPGMDVAQINANTWAISARGFNDRFSNELQVMLDGRIVYTPTFGGVFWDVFDLPFEDIERIEVIRGPGGTVWGANAVNGVINVITKNAAKTHGAMLVAGEGNLAQGFGTAQYGGALGKSADYRAYAKYFNVNHMPDAVGQNGGDEWHTLRGGFRIDGSISKKDTITSAGDMYTGREGQSITFLPSVTAAGDQTSLAEINMSGGFLQSVWEHTFSDRSETSVQASFDRYARHDLLGESRNTFNVDFQHHILWGRRQDVVWGMGYRFSSSQTERNFAVSLNPADLSTQLFNGFVQDEVAIVPDQLFASAGVKLEHNDYTGVDALPSVRVTWAPSERQMFWGAVSKAARIPASTDASLRVNAAAFPGPGGVPVLISIFGNPRIKDEGLLAYEAGYRTTILNRVTFDLAAFYNAYDHQITTEPGAPFLESTPSPPHIVLPQVSQNLMRGETYGIEIAANWRVSPRWTLSPGYSFEQIHMHTELTSQDAEAASNAEGSSPRHSAQLRSHFAWSASLAWDASAYFVDGLRDQNLPSYTRLDTQLTWRGTERLSISAVGQNLLKDRHLEFIDSNGSVNSSLIKRSGYVELRWQF